jgi:hypothetical protein
MKLDSASDLNWIRERDQAANEGWNPNIQPRDPKGRFIEEPDIADALDAIKSWVTVGRYTVGEEFNLPDDVRDELHAEFDEPHMRADQLMDVLTDESVDPEVRDHTAQSIVATAGTSEFDYIPGQRLEQAEEDIQDMQSADAIGDRVDSVVGNDITFSDRAKDELSTDQARHVGQAVIDVAKRHGIQHIEDIDVLQTVATIQANEPLGFTDKAGDIKIAVEGLREDVLGELDYENHLATAHPRHVVYHELAHTSHQDGLSSEKFVSLQKTKFKHESIDIEPPTRFDTNMIRDVLSKYATTSPIEFWAEAFAYKMTGQELPPPLQNRFEAYQ